MSNNIKTKKRIRIGNDIKLDVYLSDKYVSDAINIQSIKCVLINTTMAFEFVEDDCHHHNHHIHEHTSTACSLHSCGKHRYHCHPHNCKPLNHCDHHDHCHHVECGQPQWCNLNEDGHCDHHHAHYHPCTCHHGHLILEHPFGYPHYEHHCHPHHCHKHPKSMFSYGRYNDFIEKCVETNSTLYHDLCNHPIMPFEYVPEIISTPERNHFQVLFPAADQLFIGEYTLVVTAKIYENGYNKTNTRTVTIDYPVVFELVDTTCEADDDFFITVGLPESDNVDHICACGSNVDTILKGNMGILTAKVMPTTSKFKDIVWSNPTGGIDILNEEGETLKYIGRCCDIETGRQTFTVRASSKYFENKYVDFDVTVVNYAERLQTVSSGTVSLGAKIPNKKSAEFTAEVVMQNGERISNYKKNLQTVSATYTEGTVKDSKGVTLATVTNNGSGTYTVTNMNPYNDDRTINIVIKSSLPTEDGTPLQNVAVFTLAGQSLDVYGGYDKYVKTSDYDDDTYTLTLRRSDGENVESSLARAVGWTNK